MTPESVESVTITLARGEAQFLITVLKSSMAILTAILSLQTSLPELPPPPLNENAIASISALAQNIERQINPVFETDPQPDQPRQALCTKDPL